MRIITALLVVTAILVPAIALGGWFSSDDNETTQQSDRLVQQDVLERAQKAEPAYKPQNFLSRRAINEWTKRMDTPDKLWYVYLMSDSGAFIGYHVCQTVPMSHGVSITNPRQIVDGEDVLGLYEEGNGIKTMPAPGIDGVFYSGVGQDHYCFDAETNALINFNTDFVYYDKPVNLDAPRLNIVSN